MVCSFLTEQAGLRPRTCTQVCDFTSHAFVSPRVFAGQVGLLASEVDINDLRGFFVPGVVTRSRLGYPRREHHDCMVGLCAEEPELRFTPLSFRCIFLSTSVVRNGWV